MAVDSLGSWCRGSSCRVSVQEMGVVGLFNLPSFAVGGFEVDLALLNLFREFGRVLHNLGGFVDRLPAHADRCGHLVANLPFLSSGGGNVATSEDS